MIAYAFLYHNESALKWLVYTDGLAGQIINWLLGLFLTFVVLKRIMRPIGTAIGREWKAHRDAQEKLIISNALIADRLDPNTPGGLGDVMAELRKRDQDSQIGH